MRHTCLALCDMLISALRCKVRSQAGNVEKVMVYPEKLSILLPLTPNSFEMIEENASVHVEEAPRSRYLSLCGVSRLLQLAL